MLLQYLSTCSVLEKHLLRQHPPPSQPTPHLPPPSTPLPPLPHPTSITSSIHHPHPSRLPCLALPTPPSSLLLQSYFPLKLYGTISSRKASKNQVEATEFFLGNYGTDGAISTTIQGMLTH